MLTGTPARRPALERIEVVVPAHDEEALVGRCLEALTAERDRLAAARPDVCVAITLVLDRCTDGTAERAASYPHVAALAADCGSAGAARSHGIAHACKDIRAGSAAEQATWIACTDADSAVPEGWLDTHLELADAGHDLIVGAAVPDPADLDPAVRSAWRARHVLTEDHPYIHGANLGVRLSTYRALGGFRDVPVSEDVLLVEAAVAAGVPRTATARTPVLTCGRVVGRAPGGFAAYLDDLGRRPVEPAG